ncbi:MAG TPA: polyhydroxyalkanoate depolymerase [Candidatus Anaerofilum excrementigallinarum]|nr:polyhydroxyalkanoate depolymerase [Candidatus Anaerofilum excrementigallinarum]
MAKKTIYYISDKTGNDDNPGTSPQKALRSLAAIGERVLAPGDEIRLERGSVFRGQALHLCAQGTAGSPIVVGSYGEGPLPVIQARGSGLWYQDYGCELDTPTHVWRGYVSSAVLLYDCEYIRLEDLEICNDGPVRGERYSQADKLNRTGVAVVAQQRGTLHNIELQRLYIHDVRGNVYDKHLNNGGIYCTALRPTDPAAGIARYDGLYIHHCRVENCSRWGIAAGYTYTHSFFTGKELDDKVVETYGHTNVVLEYNFVRDIGGDGITPMYCLRPLVQFNVSDRVANEINDQVYTLAGERAGKTAAAIWPWKCKDALFQYNEAYNTCYNQDGQAWDADSGDGTIYQYNYSYNNAGGCVMFCEGESVNNIFRCNISLFDGDGVINPAHNPDDARIYNNTFILRQDVAFIRHNMSGGHMLVENNIICRTGQPAEGDWYHQTEFARYHGNLYINFTDSPTEDTQAVKADGPEGILPVPFEGPTSTDGVPHSREWFEGFAACSALVQNGPVIQPLPDQDFLGQPLEPGTIGACLKKN